MGQKIIMSIVAASFIVTANAATIELGEVAVEAKADTNTTQNKASLPSDTAMLLGKTAGVSMNTGGGISALPAIHGMADDRIKTSIDGMQITSACPNHMNPALSYVDPSKVAKIKAVAGITPVSEGGDSIGGSIIVKTKKPKFAKDDKIAFQSFEASSYRKSNGHNSGISSAIDVANDKLSFSYAGMSEKADDYKDGNGNKVKSTLFKRIDQSAILAYKINEDDTVALRVGHQEVPYEGFVNEYMDMLDNKATSENLSYEGKIGSAKIEANAFHQKTTHYMNKILSERIGNMPMNTEAKESGYNIAATIPLSEIHTIKIGSDYDNYRLNDWWPPDEINKKPGMYPNTFWNINDGKRDRLGLFAEATSSWSEKLSSNVGIRTDIVKMDTGDVVGYNSTINDPIDAAIFNALDHKKTDHNIDVTAMLTYEYSPSNDYEIGFAHKTRSPNIYERYTWAGLNTAMNGGTLTMPMMMDMRMVNWFGDGNGYVGNINLKPETADTISLTGTWHGDRDGSWNVKVTPYYTKVKDFIDADIIGTSGGINYLQFANHDATLYGVDVSADAVLWNNDSFGLGTLSGTITYTKGYREDGGDLYHIMPLNANIYLEQSIGNWTNGIDLVAVGKKDKIDADRKEPTTSGYMLVDLRTNYKISKNTSIDLAVTNLFDNAYVLPLGGIDVVDYSANTYTALAGKGRSFNVALNFKF
ncbi:MAG: TonB-dependent receptor [Sulfurovaceae bacterium]|nr:TonB-dependent receptor [Sulfurovaceae bacterium]